MNEPEKLLDDQQKRIDDALWQMFDKMFDNETQEKQCDQDEVDR